MQNLITNPGPSAPLKQRFRLGLSCALIAAAAMTWPAVVAAQGDLSSRYVALAIQGDLRSAPALFASGEPALSAGGIDLARQFRERFQSTASGDGPGSGDAFVDAVVRAYRGYWRRVLMGETPPDTGETALVSELREILATTDSWPRGAREEDIYLRVGSALDSRGFRSLLSLASPLQDLFVWRDEEPRSFEVELTDQTREVRVRFLAGFASLGWKDYASLGMAATTGWVEGDTLYCVEWAYLPESETFDVSYLKHETRHLADFEQFPGLPSAELEYRAKLTELAFATTTLPRLLEDFSAKAAPNPESPHALANKRVVDTVFRALRGESYEGETGAWAGVSAPRVNRLARMLLLQDTQRLERERAAPSPGR